MFADNLILMASCSISSGMNPEQGPQTPKTKNLLFEAG